MAKHLLIAFPPAKQMDTTALKKGMGQLGRVLQDNIIEVTKHGSVEAVIVSPEHYQQLKARAGLDSQALDDVEARYDAMFQGMQTKDHARAVNDLLNTSGFGLKRFLDDHYDQLPAGAKAHQKAGARGSALQRAERESRTRGHIESQSPHGRMRGDPETQSGNAIVDATAVAARRTLKKAK